MHYIFKLAACFFLVVASLCVATEPDQTLHKKCLYPTILVTPASREACGSGFIIKSIKQGSVYHNVFITCAHVADLDEPYVVKLFTYKNWSSLEDKKSFPCVFYAINEVKDLAIGMFITDEEMPTADLDFNTRAYIGTDAFGIGCGVGDEPRIDYGKISGVRINLGRLKQVMRTTVHTVPGDSGSALFYNYKVIGVRQAIRLVRGSPAFSISYAVPLEHLQTWDKEDGNAYDFAWKNKALPRLPYYKLGFIEDFEIIEKKQ